MQKNNDNISEEGSKDSSTLAYLQILIPTCLYLLNLNNVQCHNNHNFDYNKHVARPYNGQSDDRGNKLTIL